MKRYIHSLLRGVIPTPLSFLRVGTLYTFFGAAGTFLEFTRMRGELVLSYRSFFRESFEGLVIASSMFLLGAAFAYAFDRSR